MKIKNKYTFWQKIKLVIYLIRTKLICKKARIIRFPFDLRGKQFIDLGERLTTGVGCRLEAFSEDGQKTMHFGRNIQLNDYVHICSMKSVSIGNNVLLASKIYISDNSHGFYKGDKNDTSPNIPPTERPYYTASVVIEDNVWIGEGVMVLPGVTIGQGAIIGANAVVSKSIEPKTIAVGQPAVSIKKYNEQSMRWERI